MKRFVTLSLILSLILGGLFAKPVQKNEAGHIARMFLNNLDASRDIHILKIESFLNLQSSFFF